MDNLIQKLKEKDESLIKFQAKFEQEINLQAELDEAHEQLQNFDSKHFEDLTYQRESVDQQIRDLHEENQELKNKISQAKNRTLETGEQLQNEEDKNGKNEFLRHSQNEVFLFKLSKIRASNMKKKF
jgi:chromosome segregation ATPase